MILAQLQLEEEEEEQEEKEDEEICGWRERLAGRQEEWKIPPPPGRLEGREMDGGCLGSGDGGIAEDDGD